MGELPEVVKNKKTSVVGEIQEHENVVLQSKIKEDKVFLSSEQKHSLASELVDTTKNLDAKTDINNELMPQIIRLDAYAFLMKNSKLKEISEIIKRDRISKKRLGRKELTAVSTQELMDEKKEEDSFFSKMFGRK